MKRKHKEEMEGVNDNINTDNYISNNNAGASCIEI